jgi:tetratricopeptide (TPR) repeat protein
VNQRATLFTVFGLILISVLVFGQAAGFGFVYDDGLYVTKNAQVQQGLNRASVEWALRPQIGHWHPLTWLSLMLDVELFGVNATAHHLVNLLLHLVNTVLLFWALRRMTSAHWPSALVAVLFAIHPLHVEPVVWIASRKDVLSTLFWLLTLWTYHAYATQPSFARYVLVVAGLFFGLAAKAMVVTLPCVLLLLDYWPLRRLESVSTWRETARRWGVLALEKVPLFALAAFFSVMAYRAGTQSGVVGSSGSFPLSVRIESAVLNYGLYLAKTVWPQGLAVHYPHAGEAIALGSVALALAALLAITLGAWWARGRAPYLLVGWLWYLGTLVPVSGLLQLSVHAAADRYTYVPLIGVFIMLAFGVAGMAAHGRAGKRVAVALCVAAVVALMVCAGVQARHWRDTLALWTHAQAVTSNSFIAHNNLGQELSRRGFLEEAEAEYRRAVAINPRYEHAHNNLGYVLIVQGRREEAIAAFEEAIRCNPGFALAHSNLARARADTGGGRRATADLRVAVTYDLDNPRKHFELGEALHAEGNTNEALAALREAVRLDADYVDARRALFRVLLDMERPAEATTQLREIVRITPDDPNARVNLGIALRKQDRRREAEEQFSEALRLDPDHQKARRELAQEMPGG